uniref:Brefeldin A-inhibited guanine nucleotide-exchange protein 1 n=1 Tax=Cacopsylla melanoneura TaxID=428564 RepID=A0A8D8VEW3_9HEMI
MSGYALCLILVLTALESFCKATENVQGLNKESEEEHNPLTEDKSHLTEHKDDEGREEHKINEEDENVSFGNETYVFNKQDEKRELYKANVLSSSFDKVATAGVLIDKSYVIKEMFKVKKKVILLTRPPRWGKSLTLDMIKAFLDVEVDNMGSKIAPSLLTKPKMFHGSSYDVDNIGYKRLKVSNSGICKKMCEYPVIHLDLGDIDGYNESQILWNMYDKIDEVFQKQFPYLNETNFLNGLSEENDIKLRLERFTGRGTVEYSEFKKSITFLSNVLSKIYNNDPVILIDNYDKSLLNLYLKYGPNHESSVTLRKALEDLLKKTLRHNPHVRKAFVTGVFPCAKYDLLNKVDLLDSNVFNQYFDTLGPMLLPDFYVQIHWCVQQSNEELAKAGATNLENLVIHNAAKFSPVTWQVTCDALVAMFGTSVPHELLSWSPSDENNTVDEKHGELEPVHVTKTVAQFQALLIRSRVQLELIRTVDNILFYPVTSRKEDEETLALAQADLLHREHLITGNTSTHHQQEEEQGVFRSLTCEHLMSLVDCLLETHRFAKTFNSNHEQRNRLWKAGYNCKEKPNLLPQETQSLACVLRILFKMSAAEQMRSEWHRIEARLISVNNEALEYFLSLQYETHRDAWTTLLLLILTKILKMADDKFRVHTGAYYPRLCDLMCFDLKPELRSVLRKYFLRLGTVYGVL